MIIFCNLGTDSKPFKLDTVYSFDAMDTKNVYKKPFVPQATALKNTFFLTFSAIYSITWDIHDVNVVSNILTTYSIPDGHIFHSCE